MGNEASAIQPHAGLSKSEIENLQKTFPKTPTKQLWSPWSEVFEAEQLDVLSKTLVNKTGVISFQNYQQLAGDLGKGGLESKIEFMLMIGKVLESNLTTDSLKTCLKLIFKAFSKANKKKNLSTSDEDSAKLASSLVHDLIFHGESCNLWIGRVSLPQVGMTA